MTRLNQLHGGVNLSQGFPDFPAPAAVKEAACAAIQADVNQYAVTWGARALREAIAREFTRRYGVPVDADEQVTVCCGATEAMMATMMAIIDPGDEVVIFEPFYENYGPDAILSGATPRYVTLHEPGRRPAGDAWTFDPDELAAAFNDQTKAIILNTPNNPDREGVHARRARDDRRALPEMGRRRDLATRSTSTSSTTAARTCRSRRSTGWPIGRSRSTACRRPTASRAGASAGRSRRRR